MIPMNTLTPFLGISSEEEEFKSLLEEYYIFNLPEYIIDDGDFDYESSIDTLNAFSERNSLALIYQERETYELLYPKKNPITGDFVFKEISLYAKDDYNIGYQGVLPFSLQFSMSPSEVHVLLSAPIATRDINGVLTELYYIHGLMVNIIYDEGVYNIHIRNPHVYDFQMIGRPLPNFPPVNESHALDATKWIPLLGKHLFSAELAETLPPYDDEDIEVEDCDFCVFIDLINHFGLTLFYNNSNKYKQKKGLLDEGLIFAGYRLSRRGQKYSQGFQGIIPYNLNFSMSPEEMSQNIGHNPTNEDVGDDNAAYAWELENCILHVYFDLIDYQPLSFSFYGLFMKDFFDD